MREVVQDQPDLAAVLSSWRSAWEAALADWSPYVQLHEPHWCLELADEQREQLSSSFAMIRLSDHTVVISLRRVLQLGLQDFAAEILAHEIGHHVYCPGDLIDNGRSLARIRRGLPGCEAAAPLAANLYADLLINDRLQRHRNRRIAEVYRLLNRQQSGGRVWWLYMRIYELLWNLEPGTLAAGTGETRINQDALLGARLVRTYSQQWLAGAGRFACLLLPYVSEEWEAARKQWQLWSDTLLAGAGEVPAGLAEIDEDELTGVLHPAEDPVLAGLDLPTSESDVKFGKGRTAGEDSGHKSQKNFRDPIAYAELLRAAGLNLDNRQLAVRYYRELAQPYLIPFPGRPQPATCDIIPEGVDLWEMDQELAEIDWFETLVASSQVVPGVTTRRRLMGETPDQLPKPIPLDLYLGIDCSGSMGDPAYKLSYPALAGTVMALSALRSGANVKVVLSGEPGSSIATQGFVRQPAEVLEILLNYLGTGYAFGIHRLSETFAEPLPVPRPTHILVISDYDMFAMLNSEAEHRSGWEVARQAASRCGGGATYVLQLPGYERQTEGKYARELQRMTDEGWHVHLVNSMEELLLFAREFSRAHYHPGTA